MALSEAGQKKKTLKRSGDKIYGSLNKVSHKPTDQLCVVCWQEATTIQVTLPFVLISLLCLQEVSPHHFVFLGSCGFAVADLFYESGFYITRSKCILCFFQTDTVMQFNLIIQLLSKA